MSSKLKIILSFLTIFTICLSMMLEFNLIPHSFIYGSHDENKTAEDKSFVIVIPAFNNSETAEKTLNSILEQTYKNFQIVYIDDGSIDETSKTVQKFIENNDLKNEITLTKYIDRKGNVERLYEVVQKCADDQLIVFLPGNAWLAHTNVLKHLNEHYKSEGIWVAYGQHQNFKTGEKGACRRVSSKGLFTNSMRRKGWQHPLLKSFYAGLFKRVKLEEFFFRGKFIDNSFDEAYMFPMLEMAEKRIAFLPEIVCLYEEKAMEEDRPCLQSSLKCMQRITRALPYPALKFLKEKEIANTKPDLLIFSYDRPLQLYALLESTYRYITGFNKISVIYRCSEESYNKSYEEVKKTFKNVNFIKQSEDRYAKDFKPLLLKTAFDNSQDDSPYILFAVDDMIVKDYIDLRNPVKILEQTGAYFFSLRFGTHINYCYMGDFEQELPFHVHIDEGILGWHLDSARGDWTYPNSVDMTIYRKKDLKKIFHKIGYRNPNELEWKWCNFSNSTIKQQRKKLVGLFLENSVAVNIPLNIVNPSDNPHMNLFSKEELLDKFEEGYKIDISTLYKMANPSVHLEYEPTFILRDEKKQSQETVERIAI